MLLVKSLAVSRSQSWNEFLSKDSRFGRTDDTHESSSTFSLSLEDTYAWEIMSEKKRKKGKTVSASTAQILSRECCRHSDFHFFIFVSRIIILDENTCLGRKRRRCGRDAIRMQYTKSIQICPRLFPSLSHFPISFSSSSSSSSTSTSSPSSSSSSSASSPNFSTETYFWMSLPHANVTEQERETCKRKISHDEPRETEKERECVRERQTRRAEKN